jgi:outer membrane protein OmpA-like peptidoglycan-associated protein
MSISSVSSAQSLVNRTSSLNNAEDECAKFIALVENRDYRAAESMLVFWGGDGCNETEYFMALASLKAASFQFAEAEKILESKVNEHPDDMHLQRAWNHMVRLINQSGEFHPVNVWPTQENNPDKPILIAWMNDSVPQIIQPESRASNYFPVRENGMHIMGFDEESNVSSYPIEKVKRKLEAKRYEEVGPGVFLPDSTLVITAVRRMPYSGKGQSERLELIVFDIGADYKGLLPFSQGDENNAFPVYSPRDSTLIFSSDRPGGYGGMDLWKTRWKMGTWSEPENLGQNINTESNEILPTISGDTLFFSSDARLRGFGGYDLFGYSFSNKQLWNLGLPLNGPYDDHSFHVYAPGNAYFVTNRTGSLEGGKIFRAEWTVAEAFFNTLKGKILNAGEISGVEVHMLNEAGEVIQKGVLSADGTFSFRHIKGEETYSLELPGQSMPDGATLQLYNGNDQLIQQVETTSQKGFKFVLLSPKDYSLQRMDDEDISLLSVDIFGKIENETASEFEIVLLDSDGKVIARTNTEANGKFGFEKVSPDANYTIVSEVIDSERPIHIIDEKGNLLQTITPSTGGYAYVRLGKDENIITLSNEFNKKVRIAASDLFDLGVVSYDRNSAAISEKDSRLLDNLATILTNNPQISLELSGHTDSRGSDEHNLQLSQKRIESVIRYLSARGVTLDRLSGKGYGESALLNHCENGVDCTEEAHAMNRRTEFRISEVNAPE